MSLEDTYDGEQTTEEENYFVSMTDMMVGLVFIFIIMLMYYAMEFQTKADIDNRLSQERAKIVRALQDKLTNKGMRGVWSEENIGVIHLPDSNFFGSGQFTLSDQGRKAVSYLADALAEVEPCYVDQGAPNGRPKSCAPDSGFRIDSIYIEGHTDSDKYKGNSDFDNWDLSVNRATSTYKEIRNEHPEVTKMCSLQHGECPAALSVSGFGDNRQIDRGQTDEAKAKNRRIDVRIVMVRPDNGEVRNRVSQRLADQ